MKSYPGANPDLFSKIVTGIFILAILVALGFWAYSPNPEARTSGMFMGLFLLLALTVSWLLIPSIGKSESHFEIQTKLHCIKIPLKEIKSVEAKAYKGLYLRLFGIGGLFGYFGYFNKGEVWYVTNRQKALCIVTKRGKVYVVSPSDPVAVASDLEKYINPK
ncbi:PH domain-containing protein [Chryseobacterium sp. A301]